MLAAGDVVAGKYCVLAKLGEGAMGSVWLARNKVTDREFALKVLLPQAAAAPMALARFFQEARVCGSLRHPSILEIYDAGTSEELAGAPYLVMERLDGAPLDLLLRQRGLLPPRLALDILVEISRGLHLAHLKGIVHRDLKPANVFLHRPGTGALVPKVLDFGISKMMASTPTAIALTQSSTVLGSPLYMSPEQMDPGRALDARSDVHALGVLLWECLTGKAPFSATTYNNLVVEIMLGPRPKLRDAMPSATPGLSRIVETAFAIDAAHRFATAAELADALDAELATWGGGVLSARTAAVDVLSALDGKAPPPVARQGATLEAPSVDTGGVASRRTADDLPLQQSSTALATSLQQSTRAAGMTRTGSVRSGTTLAAAVVLAAVVAGVAVAVVMRSSSSSTSLRPDTPDLAASGRLPPPPAETTPLGEPDPAATEAHRAAVVPSVAITPSAAVPTPSVVAIPTRPVVATPTAPAPRSTSRKKAPAEASSAPAEPKSNCDPNYYLDAQGEKHFKLECFK
jgi:serine/threonine protein kinase